MKYTLSQNAISSLSIAIEHFKKFYYHSDEYNRSKNDESIKICITFLENSVELMLKTILASISPLSIYEHPNSRAIQKALSKASETNKLEDILISEGGFKTIKYSSVVQEYNDAYHNSDKVFCVLKNLGEMRNAITHFGIDGTDAWEDLISCILNSFDVIYNYLYPQLVELDSIGDYFTTDDLVVETIHGYEPLFDNDFIFNNIVDFLDELLDTSEEYMCAMRAANPKSKINQFAELTETLFKDTKFAQMLSLYDAKIKVHNFDLKKNNYDFKITIGSELWDNISSCYSIYNNVTAFCGETGKIYFLVVHKTSELYIYNSSDHVVWPQHDEAEPDNQWLSDSEKGFCKKNNLSKRNLLLAFKNIFISEL